MAQAVKGRLAAEWQRARRKAYAWGSACMALGEAPGAMAPQEPMPAQTAWSPHAPYEAALQRIVRLIVAQTERRRGEEFLRWAPQGRGAQALLRLMGERADDPHAPRIGVWIACGPPPGPLGWAQALRLWRAGAGESGTLVGVTCPHADELLSWAWGAAGLDAACCIIIDLTDAEHAAQAMAAPWARARLSAQLAATGGRMLALVGPQTAPHAWVGPFAPFEPVL